MTLAKLLRQLLGTAAPEPRTPEAVRAVRLKQTIEQRVRRLEIALAVHLGQAPP